jgi:hypothetical protein
MSCENSWKRSGGDGDFRLVEVGENNPIGPSGTAKTAFLAQREATDSYKVLSVRL